MIASPRSVMKGYFFLFIFDTLIEFTGFTCVDRAEFHVKILAQGPTGFEKEAIPP